MEIRGDQQALLLGLLDASAKRRDVLISNLANAETPGYQRREVAFEDLLRRALERGDDPARVTPNVIVDALSPAREDGNNVNLEKELTGLRENRLMYESYTAILGSHFELMRAAIESGR